MEEVESDRSRAAPHFEVRWGTLSELIRRGPCIGERKTSCPWIGAISGDLAGVGEHGGGSEFSAVDMKLVRCARVGVPRLIEVARRYRCASIRGRSGRAPRARSPETDQSDAYDQRDRDGPKSVWANRAIHANEIEFRSGRSTVSSFLRAREDRSPSVCPVREVHWSM